MQMILTELMIMMRMTMMIFDKVGGGDEGGTNYTLRQPPVLLDLDTW